VDHAETATFVFLDLANDLLQRPHLSVLIGINQIFMTFRSVILNELWL